MPRGAYTAKQERKADHIEEGYEKRGVGKKEPDGRSSSRSAAAKKGWETRRRHGKG